MKGKKIIINTLVTLAIPTGMFLLLFMVTRANGVTYYGSRDMWRTIFVKLIMSVPMGCAIGIQMRNGRMDFSGGITMILSAIIAGTLTQKIGGGPVMMLGLCILSSVGISMITATVYTLTRLPIIICTVALALLYESLTLIIGGGQGVSIINNTRLNIFGVMPYGLIILAAAMVLYHVIVSYSVMGRRGQLLGAGQQVAVNIGVNEKKNVYLTYVVSGILFGLAAVVYVSQNKVMTQSNLSTSSILFSYIVPVYIGRFLGKLSWEIIGIFVGSLTVQLMNYGLNAIGYGSGGWDNIFFGIFMMTFWVITCNLDNIKAIWTNRKAVKA